MEVSSNADIDLVRFGVVITLSIEQVGKLVGGLHMINLDEFLTVKRAAAFLGVSPNTIRNWDRDEKIPGLSSSVEPVPIVQARGSGVAATADREIGPISNWMAESRQAKPEAQMRKTQFTSLGMHSHGQ